MLQLPAGAVAGHGAFSCGYRPAARQCPLDASSQVSIPVTVCLCACPPETPLHKASCMRWQQPPFH